MECKEGRRRPGAPNSEGAPKSQSSHNQPEQEAHGGGINKPEPHPPKKMPLALKPSLSSQEQQPDDLDPDVERLIRAYAEAEAEGDPKKAKRLVKHYLKDSSLREVFKDFYLHGATALARSIPDFSRVLKKQEKEE